MIHFLSVIISDNKISYPIRQGGLSIPLWFKQLHTCRFMKAQVYDCLSQKNPLVGATLSEILLQEPVCEELALIH